MTPRGLCPNPSHAPDPQPVPAPPLASPVSPSPRPFPPDARPHLVPTHTPASPRTWLKRPSDQLLPQAQGSHPSLVTGTPDSGPSAWRGPTSTSSQAPLPARKDSGAGAVRCETGPRSRGPRGSLGAAIPAHGATKPPAQDPLRFPGVGPLPPSQNRGPGQAQEERCRETEPSLASPWR